MTSKDWKLLLPDLPYDDEGDGDALRRLVSDGSDLSKPLQIDFAVAVPSEDSARALEVAVLPFGFKPEIYHDDNDGSWTCNCTKTLIPTYDEIVAIQAQLDEISKPFGGKSDGWGSFGNAPG